MLEEGYFYFFSWEEFKDLYRIFSDTSKIRKSKINIKEIRTYVDLFQNFGGVSRYYSEDRAPSYLSVDREPIKPRLKPIIPDIRTFLKEVKINYNVKKEKVEEILSHRIFADQRYITLKELLREN